jgi:hypothetical protein
MLLAVSCWDGKDWRLSLLGQHTRYQGKDHIEVPELGRMTGCLLQIKYA